MMPPKNEDNIITEYDAYSYAEYVMSDIMKTTTMVEIITEYLNKQDIIPCNFINIREI